MESQLQREDSANKNALPWGRYFLLILRGQFIFHGRRSRVWRYGVAITLINLLALVRIAIPFLNQSPYLLMTAGVFVAGLYGGFIPGLVALGLSILLQLYYFISPELTLSAQKIPSIFTPEIIIFSGFCLLLITTISALLYTRRRGEEYDLESQQQQEALRQSEQRQRFLAEASSLLSSSLDYLGILRNVAYLTVPFMGDWATVDIVAESDKPVQLAVAHRDPNNIELFHHLSSEFSAVTGGIFGIPSSVKQGHAVLIPEVSAEYLDGLLESNLHRQAVMDLKLISAMIYPIFAQEKIVGYIAWATSESAHVYTPKDMEFAQEVVSRIQTAVENALLFSESEKLAAERTAILSQISEGVLIVDKLGKVVFVNEQARNFSVLANALGKTVPYFAVGFYDLTGEPISSTDLPLSKAYLSGETITNQEMMILSEKGEKSYILVNANPILNEFGEQLGAVSSFHDISQRYWSEKNQAEIVQTASHELKTPLTSLRLYAEALLNNAKKYQLPAPLLASIRAMERQSAKLSRLVDNILDTSKTESGNLKLRTRRLELGQIVKEALEPYKVIYPDIQLIQKERELYVNGDPDRLDQALGNLVTNATQHSTPGQPITVTLAGTETEVIVQVANIGMGIAEDKLARVFERYYQVDAPNTSGMGLGLYLTKQIIDHHQGKIWVESDLGKGVVFTITLPRGPSSPNALVLRKIGPKFQK